MDTIKKPQKTQELIKARKIFGDYAIMLGAILICSIYLYGTRVLLLSFISVMSCFVCRWLGEKIMGNKSSAMDFASLCAGLSVAMLLPITAPWWFALIGGAFASIVCMIPFGSALKSPFTPALTAVCFLTLCFGNEMVNYDASGVLSLSAMLKQGSSIVVNPIAIMGAFTGIYPSAIGSGCIILLLGALVFLTIRRPRDTVPAYVFLLTTCVFALIFPRVHTGRLMSLTMELCSGMLLFSAVFFMTYPSVMPERLVSRVLWGFTSGIICMVIRHIGAFEESVLFGVILSQSIMGFFETLPLTRREKKQIVSSPEYAEEEEEEIPTVVPQKILNEIPDMTEEEILEQTDEEETAEEKPVESVSLAEAVSEENSIQPDGAPFMTGGDRDEE